MNEAPEYVLEDAEGGELPNPGLREWLARISLQDLLCAHQHSRDFNGSRAEYIYLRVRLLAFLFAALALMWVPVDMLLLKGTDSTWMLALRLLFSALFLLVGLWTAAPHSLDLARLRVGTFVVIPSLFYLGSGAVLNGDYGNAEIVVGYSFLPYVMVSLLAIFPLTVLEGIVYTLAIGLVVVVNELLFGHLFSLTTFSQFWLLGLLASIAMWAELAQLHMLLQLYREATRDALTGLVNRAVLTKWLTLEVVRADNQNSDLSVLLLDLDMFKRINDTYGHLAGDRVLQVFARLLLRELRDTHLVGRYGGEEFLAILPEHSQQQALDVADRIRAACHDSRIKGQDGQTISFTVSIGVAQYQRGETGESLLKRVDKGLYRAKEAGRDMAVLA